MDKQASAILARARHYRPAMVRFLRALIAIPSESGREEGVIDRIVKEMRKLRAFDEIRVDGLGSLIGRVGRGPRVLAIDAHVDTVGVGDRTAWKHDPYKARISRGAIWGRGAGDQEGAIPSMVYAARIIRDLKLPTSEFSLYMTFTVMEEDCDGLCWQYLIREEGLRPECVVITDSTNCRILRGQRGRMEIGVWTKGRSCHGSMPHKGDNAVYKIAKVINEIEKLNTRLKNDEFLGPGTVTVTYVDCKTPSMCAVPDAAFIHLDRRLTTGETKALAIRQVEDAVRRAGVEARVEVLRYAKPAYTGRVYETENYFPTWVVKESSPPVQAAMNAYEQLFGTRPPVGRWTFSTNAVAVAGMFGIPCVGFGPAAEEVAHTVNDSVPIKHLETCAAFYAAFPQAYCAGLADGKAQRAGTAAAHQTRSPRCKRKSY